MKRKRLLLTEILKNSNKTGKIFLFLAAVAVCFCMANEAMAQEVDSGTTGNCTWTLTGPPDNYTLTISGTGAMGNYDFYAPWVSYNSSIITLIIEDGVTSIGNNAFSRCTGLASVTIGSSVESIGKWSFSYCESLASITVGSRVTSIEYSAFTNCIGLTAIDVSEDNTAYASEDGALFNKEKTVLIRYPQGKQDTNYTIPNSVKSIGNDAFFWCISLGSITIPNSVTNMGNRVFYNCTALTSIDIPANVESIGDEVFSDCSSLGTVTVPNSVKSIGDMAFFNCTGLTSISIGSGVMSIGFEAFYRCESLTAIDVSGNNVAYASENGILFNKEKTTLLLYPAGKTDANYTIPDGVTNIGDEAFSHCIGLTSVTIPSGVTSIGEYAFSDCSSLGTIIIPESVTSIGYRAFLYCSSLTSVTVGNGVKNIGGMAFGYCSNLSSITIPDGVTSIGHGAFLSCSSLASVTIPESVTDIGEEAFSGCSSLTEITNLNPTPQALNSNVFYGITLHNVTLRVPAESTGRYTIAFVWGSFGTITAYTPSAINVPAIANAIRIYPNPVSESFRIDGLTAPTPITVMDISGKTLLQQTVKGDESISVGYLPKGIYLIRVNGITAKIIKN
jgi:hypothetical protein